MVLAGRYGIDGNTDKFDSDRNVIFYDMGALSTKASLAGCTAPHRTAPHRTAPHRTAWHGTAGEPRGVR